MNITTMLYSLSKVLIWGNTLSFTKLYWATNKTLRSWSQTAIRWSLKTFKLKSDLSNDNSLFQGGIYVMTITYSLMYLQHQVILDFYFSKIWIFEYFTSIMNQTDQLYLYIFDKSLKYRENWQRSKYSMCIRLG